MVNYEDAKIYRIVCNQTGLQYIGATTAPLRKRLYEHKSDYKRWKSGKKGYVTSFHIIENGDYDIVLVESVSCTNKDEMHQRERFYIESLDCVNRYIPSRTQAEYYNANKNDILAQQKLYRQSKQANQPTELYVDTTNDHEGESNSEGNQ